MIAKRASSQENGAKPPTNGSSPIRAMLLSGQLSKGNIVTFTEKTYLVYLIFRKEDQKGLITNE